MSKIIYENNTIKKKYYDWQNERFINEIYWLKKLSKFNFVPKVLAIDYKKRVLTLTNEGQRVNSFNIPKNWKVQLNKILNLLIESNCFHGDINSENLLVKNKKLKLIDFAQSTKKRGEKIIYLKKRMFFDKYAENRIALSIKKSFFNSNDLRSIIVWDKKNIGLIEKEILHNPNLKVLDKIYISKNFYEDIYKDKIFWLDQFYNRFIDRKSPKLKTDIYCYIVVSKKPIFKSNKMFFTKDYRIVDNNIFIFKKKIRKKRRNIIHISDNFEEAKRNAFYLSRSKKGFPYQYFTKSQYQHKSMKSLVEKLNKEKNLKYVFLRGAAKKNDDIDVLCNSYYLFKRSIDGQSFKKKNLRLFSNAGDPLEDYGFKVSNFAKIKNKEICFDIRSVGDNYFCERWQKKLLVGRIKKENYFSLNKNDKLYSLIYHIVYHKGYIDNKYLKFLKINFKKEQINLDFLKDKINKYLKLNNYSYTRPSDLTIPLTFKMTKKEYLEELKYIDGQVETNNNSGANKMMYNVIRYQSLYNCCHISFLYLLIKNQIMFLKKILKNFIFKKVSRTFIGL